MSLTSRAGRSSGGSVDMFLAMLPTTYLPTQFEGDRVQAVSLIHSRPFASLISIDCTGLPYVMHLQLTLKRG